MTFLALRLENEMCVPLKARTNLIDTKWQFQYMPLVLLADLLGIQICGLFYESSLSGLGTAVILLPLVSGKTPYHRNVIIQTQTHRVGQNIIYIW